MVPLDALGPRAGDAGRGLGESGEASRISVHRAASSSDHADAAVTLVGMAHAPPTCFNSCLRCYFRCLWRISGGPEPGFETIYGRAVALYSRKIRDEIKNDVFRRAGLPLIRLSTTGSGESIIITDAVRTAVGIARNA